MENTKWITILITAMLVISALAGVILGIRDEWNAEESGE